MSLIDLLWGSRISTSVRKGSLFIGAIFLTERNFKGENNLHFITLYSLKEASFSS